MMFRVCCSRMLCPCPQVFVCKREIMEDVKNKAPALGWPCWFFASTLLVA